MQRVPFTCERKGDVFVVGGSIDEQAQLAPLVRWTVNGVLTLDLGGVQFINSLGVREWVRLQTAAREAHVRLELLRVAEVLIHQLNIVPAARAASTVTSFYATYLCDHCGEEHDELIDVEANRVALAAMKAPSAMCRACKKPSVLAEAPELYFSFLAGASPLR
jgi:anti-anti-sigma regulatory factor